MGLSRKLAALLLGFCCAYPLWCQEPQTTDNSITLKVEPPTTPAGQEFAERMLPLVDVSRKMLFHFNQKLKLPQPLEVCLCELGQPPRMRYLPRAHRVEIGYEMVGPLQDNLATLELGESAQSSLGPDALAYLILSEVTYALIRELDLPVTGRATDTEDQFLAQMLLPTPEGKHLLEVAWIYNMTLWHRTKEGGSSLGWRAESLPFQRGMTLFLALFHIDPEAGQLDLAKIMNMSARALEEQDRETSRWLRAWERILEPHTRPANLSPSRQSRLYSGAFRLVLQPSRNRQATRVGGWQSQLQKLIQNWNRQVNLPRDIELQFCDSEVATAAYLPQEHRIRVSYGYLEDLQTLANQAYPFSGNNSRRIFHHLVVVLHHELAHALIQELDLPATGRQEDAADEFAALCLSATASQRQMVMDSVRFYREFSRHRFEGIYVERMQDEHGLDVQRESRLSSLIYAADPENFEPAQLALLPKATLREARIDYPRRVRAWKAMLSPHLKKGSGFPPTAGPGRDSGPISRRARANSEEGDG